MSSNFVAIPNKSQKQFKTPKHKNNKRYKIQKDCVVEVVFSHGGYGVYERPPLRKGCEAIRAV
jgi:hypothetical protein